MTHKNKNSQENEALNSDTIEQSHQSYGVFAKVLHWITALLILGLLSVGFFMVQMTYGDTKLFIYMMHKSFGMCVFAIGIIRVFWRLFTPYPKSLDTHTKTEKFLSKSAHIALYLCLFALPLSGWIMSSASGFDVNIFGLFLLPDITAKSENLFEFSRMAHGMLAFAIFGLIILHFLGAVKHHIIDKDITLKRMIFTDQNRLSVPFVILPSLLLFGFIGVYSTKYAVKTLPKWQKTIQSYSSADKTAEISNTEQFSNPVSDLDNQSPSENAQTINIPTWTILKDQSTLSFTVPVYGKDFSGKFTDFDGYIAFDPENPDQSTVHIIVKTGSVTSDDQEKNGYLIMKPWLSVESFPESCFTNTSIVKNTTNQYVMDGFLYLKGTETPISIDFTFNSSQKESDRIQAHVVGKTVIDRLSYDIGDTEWVTPETVGQQVIVNFDLYAEQAETGPLDQDHVLEECKQNK